MKLFACAACRRHFGLGTHIEIAQGPGYCDYHNDRTGRKHLMKYVVMMVPSNCPLNLNLITIQDAERMVDWQVVGGNRRKDYAITELKDGKLFSCANGEELTPVQSIYTVGAWSEFMTILKNG